MRKAILSLGVSLDGHIARPDGAFDFLFLPEDFTLAPFLATIDTILMGRKSWEQTVAFGPPGQPGAAVYVFSRSQPPGLRDGAIFTNESPAALLDRLRRQPGADIWLYGGAELARAFLLSGQIDELHLGIVPTLLGSGIPLFAPGFPQHDFELISCASYSRGLVYLTYRRVGKPETPPPPTPSVTL